jgi:hypothetical protein
MVHLYTIIHGGGFVFLWVWVGCFLCRCPRFFLFLPVLSLVFGLGFLVFPLLLLLFPFFLFPLSSFFPYLSASPSAPLRYHPQHFPSFLTLPCSQYSESEHPRPKHPVESTCPPRMTSSSIRGYVSMSNTTQNLRRNYTSLELAALHV